MPMGFGNASFPPERCPTIAQLAAIIERQSSLAVLVQPQQSYDPHEEEADLAFAVAPEERVRVSGCQAEVADGSTSSAALQGAPQQLWMINLMSPLVRQPTLFFMAKIGLEELGGHSADPIPHDIRQAFWRPLSEAELRKRCRRNRLTASVEAAIALLLLPAWIALGIIFMFPMLIWWCGRSTAAWAMKRWRAKHRE